MRSKRQSYTVRSSTLFTFGYPKLMLSLLQYISFYFNINIGTFVGFQIAVYAYVVLRTFTYTSSSSPSSRLAGVLFYFDLYLHAAYGNTTCISLRSGKRGLSLKACVCSRYINNKLYYIYYLKLYIKKDLEC